METTSARRLAELVGDLGGARSPRYAALAGRVRMLVADGRVPLGTRLPAERDLATALALSRATVTAAYARLREDGWATARQGAGTFAALPAGPHRGAWVPGPVDDGTIDMAHAAPSAPSSVPAAFAAALTELPRYLPQHGYHPAGLPDLRARIAERYTARGLPTTPEQVLVTAGALHGVSTAFQTVLRRGQRLLVEQPTYPNALDAARAVGARLLPTALDADRPGDWLEAAERALRTVRPAAAYLMPDFHNPTGRLLDTAAREQLAGALRRAGTTAVVDETFAELWLDAPAPPPLAAFGDGHLSVGSLSKTSWGGLRIGWVRADAETVQRLTAVAVRSMMAGPVVEQLAACALLDGFRGGPRGAPAAVARAARSADRGAAGEAAGLARARAGRRPGALVRAALGAVAGAGRGGGGARPAARGRPAVRHRPCPRRPAAPAVHAPAGRAPERRHAARACRRRCRPRRPAPTAVCVRRRIPVV